MSADTSCSERLGTDQLWSWNFKFIDWLAIATPPAWMVINVYILLNVDQEFLRYRGLMVSGPWINSLIFSSIYTIRPTSNSTRIPLLVWIGFSLLGIAMNFWYCDAVLASLPK